MITRRQLSLILLFFGLGITSYIFAVLSTLSLESSSSNLNLLTMFIYTLVGGLIALPFGYGSVILIGGEMSLKITEFIAHLTRSRHVIEVIPEEQRQNEYRISRDAPLLYFPTLIFILSMIISWNIHNLHDPRASIFHDLLHALDVFSKPLQEDLTSYSVSAIPYMLILVFLAGLVPSMVLPYF